MAVFNITQLHRPTTIEVTTAQVLHAWLRERDKVLQRTIGTRSKQEWHKSVEFHRKQLSSYNDAFEAAHARFKRAEAKKNVLSAAKQYHALCRAEAKCIEIDGKLTEFEAIYSHYDQIREANQDEYEKQAKKLLELRHVFMIHPDQLKEARAYCRDMCKNGIVYYQTAPFNCGSVWVSNDNQVFVAFENDTDAMVFKLRYGGQ